MAQQDIATLVERARHIKMTPAEKEKQRRSFAYGNANIENSAVTREIVDNAADELDSSKSRKRESTR